MKNNHDYESKLWRILEKEGLADLSQYHRPGFFDEVSLYSRTSDVSFLEDLAVAKADSVLLAFGLKLLKAVVWYETPQRAFFASLTIWNNPEDRLIVPNLFICAGPVVEKLKDQLLLQKVATPFSKRIKKLFSQLRILGPFQVLEDISTVPAVSRVFVGYGKHPYPKLIPLNTYLVSASALRRQKA